jgi:hypothetical protein
MKFYRELKKNGCIKPSNQGIDMINYSKNTVPGAKGA